MENNENMANNLGFENVVQEFNTPEQGNVNQKNQFISTQGSENTQAFPFEGEAIESGVTPQNGTGVFGMPIMNSTEQGGSEGENSFTNMTTPSVAGNAEPEMGNPVNINNENLQMNNNLGAQFSTDVMPEMQATSTETIGQPEEDIKLPSDVDTQNYEDLAYEDKMVNNANDFINSSMEMDTPNVENVVPQTTGISTSEDTEVKDFDSIISELTNDIVGVNNVAVEINERKRALRKEEAELIEQRETFEKEKENLKKALTAEKESLELKRAECDEYVKTQKQHLEETAAQFKATVQAKEKEFQEKQRKLEEDRKQLNQEKMDFAVEKASVEEKVRSEREEIEQEKEYLQNRSDRLKEIIKQFNSASKQVID